MSRLHQLMLHVVVCCHQYAQIMKRWVSGQRPIKRHTTQTESHSDVICGCFVPHLCIILCVSVVILHLFGIVLNLILIVLHWLGGVLSLFVVVLCNILIILHILLAILYLSLRQFCTTFGLFCFTFWLFCISSVKFETSCFWLFCTSLASFYVFVFILHLFHKSFYLFYSLGLWACVVIIQSVRNYFVVN